MRPHSGLINRGRLLPGLVTFLARGDWSFQRTVVASRFLLVSGGWPLEACGWEARGEGGEAEVETQDWGPPSSPLHLFDHLQL